MEQLPPGMLLTGMVNIFKEDQVLGLFVPKLRIWYNLSGQVNYIEPQEILQFFPPVPPTPPCSSGLSTHCLYLCCMAFSLGSADDERIVRFLELAGLVSHW